MSPLLLIVFGPVILVAAALFALLLGAAAAGTCESIGDLRQVAPAPPPVEALSRMTLPGPRRARAA